MPVTFDASHQRKVVEPVVGKFKSDLSELVTTNEAYCNLAAGEILQSSHSTGLTSHARHYNGFVGAIIQAYNYHNHLILRPDDVWIGILTQFSLYVNANAEALRSKLVKHEGKKELVVIQMATLRTAHYAEMADGFIADMTEFLADESIKAWIIPNFTTTTKTDKVVASVIMMSTMKSFFNYKGILMCGIPKVTLEGTLMDWIELRERVKLLHKYDLEGGLMTKWEHMLDEILGEFVNSFRGQVNLDFWDRVCSHHGGGSGPSYLSGWVSAFAAFNAQGLWQADKTVILTWNNIECKNDGWPVIDMAKIPSGVVSVPVHIDDNGTDVDTYMFAGHFSYATSDGFSIIPRTDWAIAVVDLPKEKK